MPEDELRTTPKDVEESLRKEAEDRQVAMTLILSMPQALGMLHVGFVNGITTQVGSDALTEDEIKVVEGLCDAIVEVTETGSTIRANNLRIVETLMESTPVILANKQAWADPWKRQKIEQLNTLLQAALAAEKMVGLKMNVPHDQIDSIINMLPSLNKPTVAHLYQSDWVSVETVLHEKEVRRIVPELLKAGAEGIIEYPLNKIL